MILGTHEDRLEQDNDHSIGAFDRAWKKLAQVKSCAILGSIANIAPRARHDNPITLAGLFRERRAHSTRACRTPSFPFKRQKEHFSLPKPALPKKRPDFVEDEGGGGF